MRLTYSGYCLTDDSHYLIVTTNKEGALKVNTVGEDLHRQVLVYDSLKRAKTALALHKKTYEKSVSANTYMAAFHGGRKNVAALLRPTPITITYEF